MAVCQVGKGPSVLATYSWMTCISYKERWNKTRDRQTERQKKKKHY